MNPVNCIDTNAATLALGVCEIEYMYMNNKLYRPIQKEQADWMNSICSDRWTIKHWINGKDAVLDAQKIGLGAEVMYGAVAVENNDPTAYVLFIRGTESFIEWVEDAELSLIEEPESKSKVEFGFFSVYQSLTVDGVPLRDWVKLNLLSIDNIKITVVGHSLGSAVSCYVAAFIAKDSIALDKDPTRLITFACPKPGDCKFSIFMADNIACNSEVYNYERDIVPKLPPFDDFVDPPNVKILKADSLVKIPDNPISNHLLPAYEALLDPAFISALSASGIMAVFENGKLSLKSIGSAIKSGWKVIRSYL